MDELHLASAKSAEGVVVPRIFNDGLAVDGNRIGNYTNKAYRELRMSEGLQVAYVDCMRTGDLFGSTTVGTNEGKPAFGILSGGGAVESSEKARNVEFLKKKIIFTMSQNELQEVSEKTLEYADKRLKELLQ
jgi:hypothetical protein